MILIHESYLDPMDNSLWSFDINQMTIQAQGILSLPHIKKVEVYELLGGQENPVCSIGGIDDKDYVKQSFQLNYTSHGVSKHIGNLVVFAGLDHIREEIRQKVVGSFGIKVAEILIFCVFAIVIFHYVILKHLRRIQRFLSDTEYAPADRALTLNRNPGKKKDILDNLVDSLNGMIEKYASACSRMDDMSEELEKIRRELSQTHAAMDMLETMKAVEDDVSAILYDDSNLESLAQNLINYMIRYFGAGVGLFYSVDQDKGLIKALAGYGIALSRANPIEFRIGEGQVGQAVVNSAPLLIEGGDKTSLKIHSSLVEGKPKCILIYPFKRHGRVTCVLEMGSFSQFDQKHLHELDRLSERVAMAVESVLVKGEKTALERHIRNMEKHHTQV